MAQQPLLQPQADTYDDSDSDLYIEKDANEVDVRGRYHALRRSFYVLAFLYGILTLIYIILVVDILKQRHHQSAPFCDCATASKIHSDNEAKFPGIFPSLAESGAFQYEDRAFEVKLHENPFTGPPRAELDLAWHEFFEKIRMQLPASDLEFYNATSLKVTGADGDMASEFSVHHEIHCLKKIRHWVNKEYYFDLPNMAEAERKEWESHIDHCIEYIRLSSMCHADTSLTSFKWVEMTQRERTANALLEDGTSGVEGKWHITADVTGTHRCVKWDPLLEWVRERAIPIFQDGVLEGPEGSEI